MAYKGMLGYPCTSKPMFQWVIDMVDFRNKEYSEGIDELDSAMNKVMCYVLNKIESQPEKKSTQKFEFINNENLHSM